ncbi:MAG TPA: hypothetical protein PLP43_07615, partial [Methanoculleus sp.]|nr:hypothetical protein [Methanoculleus sp.]
HPHVARLHRLLDDAVQHRPCNHPGVEPGLYPVFEDPPDLAGESYYCQFKCHGPAGDDYYVTFTKKTVRVSSYQDDAIETWADLVPVLM